MHAEKETKCMHRDLRLKVFGIQKSPLILMCVCATPSLVSPCETYQKPATHGLGRRANSQSSIKGLESLTWLGAFVGSLVAGIIADFGLPRTCEMYETLLNEMK